MHVRVVSIKKKKLLLICNYSKVFFFLNQKSILYVVPYFQFKIFKFKMIYYIVLKHIFLYLTQNLNLFILLDS